MLALGDLQGRDVLGSWTRRDQTQIVRKQAIEGGEQHARPCPWELSVKVTKIARGSSAESPAVSSSAERCGPGLSPAASSQPLTCSLAGMP